MLGVWSFELRGIWEVFASPFFWSLLDFFQDQWSFGFVVGVLRWDVNLLIVWNILRHFEIYEAKYE